VTQEEVVGLVVDALEGAGLAYMVAGSFASNLHGKPRMTQDADVVLDADEVAVARLIGLLGDAFYASTDAAREAVRYRTMFNVIHLETAFKVDLVVKKERPFSDEELRRRSSGPLAGREVPFATAEDTVLAKLEWARKGDSARQYEDASGVVEVQDERLDWPYLERWADALGVRDLLDRARQGLPFR